jgi:alpha-D-xyloside xylohydrolase
MPLQKDEQVYGLGLQLMSFNQRGKKKMLRMNSDPVADTGDSHAPVPFYVTTEGYGVLFDTLRYMTIYCGGANRADNVVTTDTGSQSVVSGSQELYQSRTREGSAEIIAEIPRAQGIDIYIFAGPHMREAVQRYNLFSGGGCLPPRWGLGVWYRCKSDYNHDAVLDRAKKFRDCRIPCDVFGLEPGWQTRSYSNSHIWSDRFPDPTATMATLSKDNIRINLWTHAFIHPTSPLFDHMKDKAGDFLVWGGVVPDFADPEARQTFADFYKKTHVDKGASGYKLDECDGSDFIGSPWSFPEFSKFPSGLDGEQMHSAYGNLFLQTINGIYEERNQRTYGEVRAAQALSASYPYVFYSDLYDHTCFIRGVVNSGFAGVLWAPEVRDAENAEDLIRRIQAVVFSPQAIVNAWYIKNAPWEQWLTDENNEDRFQEDRGWVTEICRDMLQLRMKFLPYIYSAFVDYYQKGIPPFRGLIMDYPDDPNLWRNDLEYMMGDRLLVAPVVAGEQARDVYLPKGGWRDFWTGKRYEGGQSYRLAVPIDKILVFVKDNCILPLAGDAQHANDPVLFDLNVTVYGNGQQGFTLYEDDGETFAYRHDAMNRVDLAWDGNGIGLKREGNTNVSLYRVKGWTVS